jgi:hypothetical protein
MLLKSNSVITNFLGPSIFARSSNDIVKNMGPNNSINLVRYNHEFVITVIVTTPTKYRYKIDVKFVK